MQAELPKSIDSSSHAKDYHFDPVLMELCRVASQLLTKVREGREGEREGGRERTLEGGEGASERASVHRIEGGEGAPEGGREGGREGGKLV